MEVACTNLRMEMTIIDLFRDSLKKTNLMPITKGSQGWFQATTKNSEYEAYDDSYATGL